MNLRRVALSLTIAISTLLPLSASAHTLKTAGQIGVLLHIEPDDAPLATVPTTLEFIIDDQSQRFKASQCTCQVTVSLGDRSLRTQSAANSSSDDISVKQAYTFTEAGIYTLKITAAPKPGTTFQPFSLSFDVRVEAAPGDPNSPLHNAGDVVLGAGVVGIFWLILKDIEAVMRRSSSKQP